MIGDLHECFEGAFGIWGCPKGCRGAICAPERCMRRTRLEVIIFTLSRLKLNSSAGLRRRYRSFMGCAV